MIIKNQVGISGSFHEQFQHSYIEIKLDTLSLEAQKKDIEIEILIEQIKGDLQQYLKEV